MKRISIILAVLAVILGGFAYTRSVMPESPAPAEAPRTSVTLAIADVVPAYRAEIAEGTTLLQLLRDESAAKGFAMEEKEYAGLGSLVERLGDLRNGTDGKYWTYTVNGAFAPVGADVYEPVAGDRIEWTFAAPESSD